MKFGVEIPRVVPHRGHLQPLTAGDPARHSVGIEPWIAAAGGVLKPTTGWWPRGVPVRTGFLHPQDIKGDSILFFFVCMNWDQNIKGKVPLMGSTIPNV